MVAVAMATLAPALAQENRLDTGKDPQPPRPRSTPSNASSRQRILEEPQPLLPISVPSSASSRQRILEEIQLPFPGSASPSVASRRCILEETQSASPSPSASYRRRILAPLLAHHLSHQGPAFVDTVLNRISWNLQAFDLNPGSLGVRGGKLYYKPVGWMRFAICTDGPEDDDWCIAYHGSITENLTCMLAVALQGPREQYQVRHGQNGGTGRSIYLSPSVEYAGNPTYAPLVQLGEEHWGQLVFECRVRPGHFHEQGSALPSHLWPRDVPFDAYHGKNNVEWRVDDPGAVIVSGLMVREFGSGSNSQVEDYGSAAMRVSHGLRGASEEWRQLHAKELRHASTHIRPTGHLRYTWRARSERGTALPRLNHPDLRKRDSTARARSGRPCGHLERDMLSSAVCHPGGRIEFGVRAAGGIIIHGGAHVDAGARVASGATVHGGARIADHAFIAPGATVHGGAHVEPGAHIAAGTVVHGGACVLNEAIIAENCSLQGGCIISPGAMVGKNCVVHGGAKVGERAVLGEGCQLHGRSSVRDGKIVPAFTVLGVGCEF